jgi:hypothetical protein
LRAINWIKGLFRAWIALSALWLVYWGVALRPDVQLSHWNYARVRANAAVANSEVTDVIPYSEGLTVGEVAKSGLPAWEGARDFAWQELLRFAQIGVSAPIIMIILFGGTAWILRGFAAKK